MAEALEVYYGNNNKENPTAVPVSRLKKNTTTTTTTKPKPKPRATKTKQVRATLTTTKKTAKKNKRKSKKKKGRVLEVCKYGLKCHNIEPEHARYYAHPEGHDPYFARYRFDAGLSSVTDDGSDFISSSSGSSTRVEEDSDATVDYYAPGDHISASASSSGSSTLDILGSPAHTVPLGDISNTPTSSATARTNNPSVSRLQRQTAVTGSPIILTRDQVKASFKLWRPPRPQE